MAKKIRFPLQKHGGVEVRDVNSLRENFSLARVIGYLEDGKLVTWLRDRYANDLADAIEELDKESDSLAKNICEILGVSYNEEAKEDIEKVVERNKKIAVLKEYTSEKEFIDNVDLVAFEQDDIYDLLDDGAERIYLCGEQFTIPLAQEGVSYIGINNPIVVIDSKSEIDWEKKSIYLVGIRYDENYQKVIDANKNEQKSVSKNFDTSKEMFGLEDRCLYRLDGNTYEYYYECKELALYYLNFDYYRGIVWDNDFLYLIRETKQYSKSYEIVKMEIKSKKVSTICTMDWDNANAFRLLAVRGDKLYLIGDGYKFKHLVAVYDMLLNNCCIYNVGEAEKTKGVCISDDGTLAYVHNYYGQRSSEKIVEYNFATMKKKVIIDVYNIWDLSCSDGKVFVWGRDTRKNADRMHFLYEYSITDGNISKYEGETQFRAVVGKNGIIYGLERQEYYDEYRLFRKEKITGQEIEICKFKSDEVINFLVENNDYIYCFRAEPTSFYDVGMSGRMRIPNYRIKIESGEVSKINNNSFQ